MCLAKSAGAWENSGAAFDCTTCTGQRCLQVLCRSRAFRLRRLTFTWRHQRPKRNTLGPVARISILANFPGNSQRSCA